MSHILLSAPRSCSHLPPRPRVLLSAFSHLASPHLDPCHRSSKMRFVQLALLAIALGCDAFAVGLGVGARFCQQRKTFRGRKLIFSLWPTFISVGSQKFLQRHSSGERTRDGWSWRRLSWYGRYERPRSKAVRICRLWPAWR